MRLIKPSYEILPEMPLLKGIELAARTCYKSEDRITTDNTSAIKLVRTLVNRNHRAMLEFGPNLIFSVTEKIYNFIKNDVYKNQHIFMTHFNNRYVVSATPRVWSEFIDVYHILNNYNFTDYILTAVPEINHLTNNTYGVVNNVAGGIQLLQMGELDEFELFYHGYFTAKFIVDRGVSHELVRHRYPVSFAQESTRYVNYSKGKFGSEITFIIPNWLDLKEGNYKLTFVGSHPVGVFINDNYDETISVDENSNIINYLNALDFSEETYMKLINDNKWKAQQARSVLPNSLKTEILVKTTFDEWFHIFEQRIDKAAHPQMREVMIPLFKEVVDKHPKFKSLEKLL